MIILRYKPYRIIFKTSLLKAGVGKQCLLREGEIGSELKTRYYSEPLFVMKGKMAEEKLKENRQIKKQGVFNAVKSGNCTQRVIVSFREKGQGNDMSD